MSILTFLHDLAGMKTGEELDGHKSGADAIDALDGAILQARTLIASQPREALSADGLNVLSSCRTLIDEAITTHIYNDGDEIPADCAYHQAVDECDRILSLFAED